jgi:hypothetical protein
VNPRILIAMLTWLAAALFLASWFLPVMENTTGWEAFRYALAPLVPFRDLENQASQENVPRVLSALTNLVFVLLFVLWLTRQMFRPGMFVRVALACMLLNLYWPVMAWRSGELRTLLAGYYVWEGAFMFLTAAAIVTAFEARRT